MRLWGAPWRVSVRLGEEQPPQASRRRHVERDHHQGRICGTTPGPWKGRKNKRRGEGIREVQQEGTAACTACPPAD